MNRRSSHHTLIGRAVLGALAVGLGVQAAEFAAAPQMPRAALPRGSADLVVFTGAMERIDAALDLLADGVGDRLLVSGANPNAGLWLGRFERQFGPRHPGLRDWMACCIDFGVAAETTLQNALETRCWAARIPQNALILVTSASHMPRARAALGRVMPTTEIIAWPVPDTPASDAEASRAWWREFGKHLATQVLLLVPGAERAFGRSVFGDYVDGCPPDARREGLRAGVRVD